MRTHLPGDAHVDVSESNVISNIRRRQKHERYRHILAHSNCVEMNSELEEDFFVKGGVMNV